VQYAIFDCAIVRQEKETAKIFGTEKQALGGDNPIKTCQVFET
jgi:hypothetical protein